MRATVLAAVLVGSLFACLTPGLTNVIGDDDRKEIRENQKLINFTDAEVEQAYRCTGRIYCPGANPDRGWGSKMSAGAICAPGFRNGETGPCAADRIASALHMFVDKGTGKLIGQLEKCEFRSYRGHTSFLNVGDIRTFDPSGDETRNPYVNDRADKIVVRLLRPIPNCDPYDIASEEEQAEASGLEVVALTRPQGDQGPEFTGHHPLAYPCTIKKRASARKGGPSLFASDCDVNGGGSGGFTLFRRWRERGKLIVGGMFLGSGDIPMNGQPYDVATKSFTMSVGTDGDFPVIARNPRTKKCYRSEGCEASGQVRAKPPK
ncbi:hypothetical protein [Xanthobacter autotrophicus]|uniref:hypothetical protein n=1 Tax=Xanthobacter autotrophicus TaxID=280 RepID=UPI003727684E